MILKINGDINRYYVQTLCMVFFPGATFGENEQPGPDVPEVSVDVYRDGEGAAVTAYASIKLNDKLCEATESVSLAEDISFATHEAIAVGKAIFAAGKELLGHTPPWGILTGVRPAKVGPETSLWARRSFPARRSTRALSSASTSPDGTSCGRTT